MHGNQLRTLLVAAWWFILLPAFAQPNSPPDAEDPRPQGPDSQLPSRAESRHLLDAQMPPPWGPRRRATEFLAEPFVRPQQMLELLGITDSDWSRLVDGQALGSEDEETVIKLLYRMPHISWYDLDRMARPQAELRRAFEDPGGARGDIFRIRGRIERVERRSLSVRQQELFDFREFYHVTLTLSDPDFRVTVVARGVPQAWLAADAVGQPCGVSAIFLKTGVGTPDGAHGHLAARRIAWYPNADRAECPVNAGQRFLGRLGFDVGLFDYPRARNRRPLEPEERESFYQLLATMSRAQAQAASIPSETMHWGPVLQSPGDHHGRWFRLRGSVRRITKVLVRERKLQQRFNLTQYYQLDVFAPLGDQVIQIRQPDSTDGGPTYQTSFPVTFCVRQLPEFLRQQVGRDRIDQAVDLQGCFFKLWAYPSPYVARHGGQPLQLSPMLIGVAPRPAGLSTASGESPWGVILGVVFLAMLGTIWATIWMVQRRDKLAATELRKRLDSRRPDPRTEDG